MESKYLNFTTEELVIDKKFISWTNKGENSLRWNSFIIRNPEMKTKIEIARSIVTFIRNKNLILFERKEPLFQEIKKIDKTIRSKKKRVTWVSQKIVQNAELD